MDRLVGETDGSKIIRIGRTGVPEADAEKLGLDIAEELLSKGAAEILARVYGGKG